METIAIEFPARRYHATPWDAHVNEGRIEWPPSPWRLLRALLAVGYTKLRWDDGPDETTSSMIGKLSAAMPEYTLPEATDAHTRHYLPTRDKTTKVFDAFLRFSNADARLLIHYDVDLTDAERNALDRLLRGLTYLGRAESWTEARLLSPQESAVLHPSTTTGMVTPPRCQPYAVVPDGETFGDRVRLLATMPTDRFDRWRASQIETTADALEAEERAKLEAKGKSPSAAAIKKTRAKAESRFPQDLTSALQSATSTWQGQGWPQPPGSVWIDYRVPASVIRRQPLTPLATNPTADRVPALLLAIDGDGKRGTVRPLYNRALPLMELLHAESVRKAVCELELGNLPELSGKGADGEVLRGHSHAHWIPLSLFGKQRIDHVLVHCRDGFSTSAIAALAAIRWAYSKGIDRLSINLAGMGSVADIIRQLERTPACRRDGYRPLGSSRKWESVTPLVFAKYIHARGKKSPQRQLRDELIRRGFDEPASIRFWEPEEMVRRGLKGHVLTRKPGKPQPPMARSFAATLEFDRPQAGPIQLGYASHFGLGLFGAD